MFLASCGRPAASNGRNVTFCAKAFQIRSYRNPRLAVRRDEILQSSCTQAPYFHMWMGVRNADESDTPTVYDFVIEEIAARFQVSALNAFGKSVWILAGMGPPWALMVPPH